MALLNLTGRFLFPLIVFILTVTTVYSQSYTWRQVAPFPYYKAEHTLYGNNTWFAYGRIIDSMSQYSGKKIELGTTPFFMTSSDGTIWKRVTPKAVFKSGKAVVREEKIIPLKTLFLKNTFVSLARNEKNEKMIYRSEDGVIWHSTGIAASSFNYIHDRIIVEKDLRFSVSADGKRWNTSEARNVSITADDQSKVSFNDSTRGYYTDSSYVLTDNDRTIALSRDGVHWRVVEWQIFKNDSLIDDVIGYVYGNRRFVFVTSYEEKDGVVHISNDGRKWKEITIDTVELTEKYGQYLPPTEFQQIFFDDSVFYLNRIIKHINSHSGGFAPITVQYISKDGLVWKMHEDDEGRWVTKLYPIEILPGEAKLEKIDSTLAYRFRLGPDGTREPVCRQFFSKILFHNGMFLIPISTKITMYQSHDGYAWKEVPGDIDRAAFLETDPFYKKTRLFVELYSNKVGFEPDAPIMTTDDEERYEQAPRTGYIVISKDRRNWDTVFVDTLISKTRGSPDLKKYPDGLIIFAYDLGGWYSSDARSWKKLDIEKSRTDSCRVRADISAFGNDRNIYVFSNGVTRLSNSAGDQWFTVRNNCYNAMAVTWGNGKFIAAGKDGRIWVLEEN